jgi:hypothetical protein
MQARGRQAGLAKGEREFRKECYKWLAPDRRITFEELRDETEKRIDSREHGAAVLNEASRAFGV